MACSLMLRSGDTAPPPLTVNGELSLWLVRLEISQVSPYTHESVNHDRKEWARGEVHTNNLEFVLASFQSVDCFDARSHFAQALRQVPAGIYFPLEPPRSGKRDV
jgi:hypothetical protein